MFTELSDLDVIFTSQQELFQLRQRARIGSESQYEEMFGSYFKKGKSCRVQFYDRKSHTIIDCGTGDVEEARWKTKYMKEFLGDTIARNLCVQVKNWFQIVRIQLPVNAIVPSSFKMLLLVQFFMSTRIAMRIRNERKSNQDQKNDQDLLFAFYLAFLRRREIYSYRTFKDPYKNKRLFVNIKQETWRYILKEARVETELIEWYGYGINHWRFEDSITDRRTWIFYRHVRETRYLEMQRQSHLEAIIMKGHWICKICTFENTNSEFLACEICGLER